MDIFQILAAVNYFINDATAVRLRTFFIVTDSDQFKGTMKKKNSCENH
jgi:hypothetical protein